MGIDNSAVRMILLLRGSPGVSFQDTLTFGHQRNYIGTFTRRTIANKTNIPSTALTDFYSDGFLRALGATNLQFLDFSDYESATVIQDLNVPIPDSLHENFSVVMDIGTTEHVFNVTQAHENLKNLCKVGGHILMVSPANNYLGHGFFQFSPELFFRTFEKGSGFELQDLYLIKKGVLRDSWYRLNDPKNMRRRGSIQTMKRCYVAAIARKVLSDSHSSAPQQSDYVSTWEEAEISRYGAIYLRMPSFMRKLLDFTVIALLSRYRNRLTPMHFHWVNGNLAIRRVRV